VEGVYDVIASEFDQTRRYGWREFDYFVDLIDDKAKVLDVGCGNGRLYDALKRKDVEYVGIDQSAGMIKIARDNHPNVRFEVLGMTKLDFKDECFDAVFSIASFHHLPGRLLRKKSVKEMHRVLKKDGILVLTVWNLFQRKYILNLLRAVTMFLVHFGVKMSWNDFWVGWDKEKKKRYYHAFLPRELRALFKDDKWKIEEMYFTKRGTRVKFLRSFNICLIARRK